MNLFGGGDMDVGLVVTLTGVMVAGFAAVLGIWMERDQAKPPRYAYALSALIVLATLVSLMQSYIDSKETDEIQEDMARLLQHMDTIAANSGNTELEALITSELAAQSRSNPEVVEKLAQRVSDDGQDPAEILGRHLEAADVENATRKGVIKTKRTKAVSKDAAQPPVSAGASGRGRLQRGAKNRDAAASPEPAPSAARTPAPGPGAAGLPRVRPARAAPADAESPPDADADADAASAAPEPPAGRSGARRPAAKTPGSRKAKRPGSPRRTGG